MAALQGTQVSYMRYTHATRAASTWWPRQALNHSRLHLRKHTSPGERLGLLAHRCTRTGPRSTARPHRATHRFPQASVFQIEHARRGGVVLLDVGVEAAVVEDTTHLQRTQHDVAIGQHAPRRGGWFTTLNTHPAEPQSMHGCRCRQAPPPGFALPKQHLRPPVGCGNEHMRVCAA